MILDFYLIYVIILFLKSIFSRHKPIKEDIMTDRKESFFHSCNLFSFSFFFHFITIQGRLVYNTGSRVDTKLCILWNWESVCACMLKWVLNRYVKRKWKFCTQRQRCFLNMTQIYSIESNYIKVIETFEILENKWTISNYLSVFHIFSRLDKLL